MSSINTGGWGWGWKWGMGLGSPYSQKVLSYSPIAYWKMSEALGTTAIDFSGNGLNGTYDGVSLGQTGIGDGGTSVQFAGTDYLNIDSGGFDSAFVGQTGSALAWVKVTASGSWTDSATGHIYRLYQSVDDYIEITDHLDNNKLAFKYRCAGSNHDVEVAESGTGWIPVALTWSDGDNADQLKAYVSGSQVGTTQTGIGSWTGTAFVVAVIGCHWAGGGQDFLGYIAHCAFFDSVLSGTEIADLSTV